MSLSQKWRLRVRLWGQRAAASIRRKSAAVTPGNKRVSLRGVTSWHIRLYFFARCSLLTAPAPPGRRIVTERRPHSSASNPEQITNNQESPAPGAPSPVNPFVNPSPLRHRCSSQMSSSSVDTFASSSPSCEHRSTQRAPTTPSCPLWSFFDSFLSFFFFFNDITTPARWSPRVPLQWNVLVVSITGARRKEETIAFREGNPALCKHSSGCVRERHNDTGRIRKQKFRGALISDLVSSPDIAPSTG